MTLQRKLWYQNVHLQEENWWDRDRSWMNRERSRRIRDLIQDVIDDADEKWNDIARRYKLTHPDDKVPPEPTEIDPRDVIPVEDIWQESTQRPTEAQLTEALMILNETKQPPSEQTITKEK